MNTVASNMEKWGIGAVPNLPSLLAEPATKIDVVKPDGEKALIESPDLFPCLFPHSQTGACGLFDFCETTIRTFTPRFAAATTRWIMSASVKYGFIRSRRVRA